MNKTIILPGLMCDSRLWSKIDFNNHVFLDIPNYDDINKIIYSLHKTIRSYKKIDLVGFSFGGYLALKYALNYPENINKIFVISSRIDDTSQEESLSRQKVLKNISKLNFNSINSKIFQSLFERSNNKNTLLLEQMFKKQGLQKYINQLKASLQRDCLYNKLLNLNINTLFINSLNDRLVDNSKIIKLCSKNNNCDKYIINSNSHMITLEYETLLQKKLNEFFMNK